MQVNFEGQQYTFPDDASDAEINQALGGNQIQDTFDKRVRADNSVLGTAKTVGVDTLLGLGVGGEIAMEMPEKMLADRERVGAEHWASGRQQEQRSKTPGHPLAEKMWEDMESDESQHKNQMLLARAKERQARVEMRLSPAYATLETLGGVAKPIAQGLGSLPYSAPGLIAGLANLPAGAVISYLSMFETTYNSQLSENLDKGMPFATAHRHASAHGVAEGIGESIGTVAILKGGRPFVIALFQGAGISAGEEMVTKVLQMAADEHYTDKRYTKDEWVMLPLESGAAGAVGASLVQGPLESGRAYTRGAEKRAEDKATRATMDPFRKMFPELKDANNKEIFEFLEKQRKLDQEESANKKAVEDIDSQTPVNPYLQNPNAQSDYESGLDTGLERDPQQREAKALGRTLTLHAIQQAAQELLGPQLETAQEAHSRVNPPQGIPYENVLADRQAADVAAEAAATQRADARSRLAVERFLQTVEEKTQGRPLDATETNEILQTLTGNLTENPTNPAVAQAVSKALHERDVRVRAENARQLGKLTPEEIALIDHFELVELGEDVPSVEPSMVREAVESKFGHNKTQTGLADSIVAQLIQGPVLGREMVAAIATIPGGDFHGKVLQAYAQVLLNAGNYFPTVYVRQKRIDGSDYVEFIQSKENPIVAAALYDPWDHTVALNPDLYAQWTPMDLLANVLHEMNHGMVANAQNKYAAFSMDQIVGKDSVLIGNEKTIALGVKKLAELHRIARALHQKANPEFTDTDYRKSNAFYGLLSPNEFAAELNSNTRFGVWLDAQTFNTKHYEAHWNWHSDQSVSKNVLSLYKAAVNALRDAIGLKVDGATLYEQGMRELTQLIEDTRGTTRLSRILSSEATVHRSPPPPNPKKEFMEALPDQFKKIGEQLWKEKQRQENIAASKPRDSAYAPKAGVVGNSYVPLTQKYIDFKVEAHKEKDIDSGIRERIGQLTVSGGKMYAAIKGNRLLRWAVDNVNDMVRARDGLVYRRLDHPETGVTQAWDTLKEKDQVALWKVIQDPKNWKKRWLTPEIMKSEYKLSELQIAAYQKSRLQMEATIGELNAEYAKEGLKPVKTLPGYWPARWEGAYYAKILDPQGTLMRVESGNNVRQLNKRLEKFKADPKYKDWTVSKVESRPRQSDKDSIKKGVRSMFNLLTESLGKNSFEVAELEEIFNMYEELDAEKRRDFLRHTMEARSDRVEGFQGSGYGKDAVENMKDGVGALQHYLRDAAEYATTRRTAREISKLLNDRMVDAPNAKAWIQEYWNNALGIESGAATVINSLAEWIPRNIGTDPMIASKAVRVMKNQALLLFLGYFRPVFLMTQLMQPWQFMTPRFDHLATARGYKGSIGGVRSLLKGYTATMQAMTGNMSMLSPGEKAVWDYAQEMRIVDPHFLTDLEAADGKLKKNLLAHFQGQRALEFAEKFARLVALQGSVDVLNKMGVTGLEAHRTASDLVDMGMTNYQRHERAMVYNKLGILGEMISPLTTFKHNFYSQMYQFGKAALTSGNVKEMIPFFKFLSLQAIIAGAMGLPGRDDLDWLIRMAQKTGAYPADWKTPNETLVAWSADMSKPVRDTLRYGFISGLTGWDVSPSFASAQLLPLDGAASLFTVPGKYLDIAMAGLPVMQETAKMAVGGQGPTSDERGALWKQLVPSAGAGIMEAFETGPDGIVRDPSKRGAGTYQREASAFSEAQLARYAGTRLTSESDQRHILANERATGMTMSAKKASIITKAVGRWHDGQDLTALAEEYVMMGGTVQEFVTNVRGAAEDRFTTGLQRQLGTATHQQRQRSQRILEQGGKY